MNEIFRALKHDGHHAITISLMSTLCSGELKRKLPFILNEFFLRFISDQSKPV